MHALTKRIKIVGVLGGFAFPEILVEIVRNFNESKAGNAACVKQLKKLETVSNQ